jgi:hypothetical protein
MRIDCAASHAGMSFKIFPLPDSRRAVDIGTKVYMGTASHRCHFLVSCAHLPTRYPFRVFDRHNSSRGELWRSNV